MFENWKSQCLCYQNQELPITYYAPWKYNCDLSLSLLLILSFSSSLLSHRWIKPHTPSPAKLKYARTHPSHTHIYVKWHLLARWMKRWIRCIHISEARTNHVSSPPQYKRGKTITPKMSNGASFKNRLWHEPARLLGKTQREEEDFRMFQTHTYLAHEY